MNKGYVNKQDMNKFSLNILGDLFSLSSIESTDSLSLFDIVLSTYLTYKGESKLTPQISSRIISNCEDTISYLKYISGNAVQLVSLLMEKRNQCKQMLEKEELKADKQFKETIEGLIMKEMKDDNNSDWFLLKDTIKEIREYLGGDKEQIQAVISFCRDTIDVLKTNSDALAELKSSARPFYTDFRAKTHLNNSGSKKHTKLVRSNSPDFNKNSSPSKDSDIKTISSFIKNKPNSRKQEILEKRKAALKKSKGTFRMKNIT
mmetsp:Transcript_13925/g.15582  ORF Transcript_13925/g.15582 Transcript_13925/m.15582 type:complete len:261 (+) Transcript_13925:942-1724(+)